MRERRHIHLLYMVSFGILLGACTRPAPVEDPVLSWTPFPTRTPAAVSTTSVMPEVTATPEVTDLPGDTAVPVVETAAPPVSECVNDAAFLADLSLPDGIVVAPGQLLEKRWSVQNSGTCDWGPGYMLAPMWDNPFPDAGVQALYPSRAGAAGVWSVEVVAPQEQGTTFARWQALDPAGEPFGDEVYLLIEVAEPVTTETAEATPTSPVEGE